MTPYLVIAGVALLTPSLSRAVAQGIVVRRESSTGPGHERARGTPFDGMMLLALIAFAGSRATTVGTDTETYARAFDRIDPEYWWWSLGAMPHEWGYTSLALLVKAAGGDFTALLWVASAVAVLAVYSALKRASADLPLSLALYVLLAFYLTPMNLVRQGVAVALIMLAATLIAREPSWRRFLGFVVIAALAASFHSSAGLVAVLVLLLRSARLGIRGALVALAAGAVASIGVLSVPWLGALVALLNPRYVPYFEELRAGGIGLYLVLAVTVALVLYGVATSREDESTPWAALSVAGCIALMLGTQSVYVARLAEYLTIFVVLLVPNAMRASGAPQALRMGLVAGAALYYVAYLWSFGDLVPYRVEH